MMKIIGFVGGLPNTPNTHPETLERLSYDEYYWEVRRAAAMNPNTPQHIKDLTKFKNYARFTLQCC